MLCRVCRRCGLCAGDGSFVPSGTLIAEDGLFFRGDVRHGSDEGIGIAVDVGTTTVAAVAVELPSLAVLSRCGEENCQRAFGSDVMARISHALTGDGAAQERDAIVSQVLGIVARLMRSVRAKYLSERRGSPELVRVVLTGNTAMLSILCGYSVRGLSAFPFSVCGTFGFESPAAEFFNTDGTELRSATVYVPPVVSAFIGADSVCALLSCSFLHRDTPALLCDIGTNCELFLRDPATDTISCTSCAAGPAFESHGITMGMAAEEGAVVRVSRSGGAFSCSVIGGGRAKGLCGTGLLSSVGCLLSCGMIDRDGAFARGEEYVTLCDDVRLYQKDIRAFQLAKAACLSGITAVMRQKDMAAPSVSELFLAGGFGTKLDAHDAAATGLVPAGLSSACVHAGNAALSGAVMLLSDSSYRDDCEALREKCRPVDLAALPEFNDLFLSCLSFPAR